LDVSVNKAAKELLCSQFQEWYSEQICQQLKNGDDSALQPVDLRMSIVKPLGAKWMMITDLQILWMHGSQSLGRCICSNYGEWCHCPIFALQKM